ncbi:hypothetical protein [Vreelandella nanhaiensis]|uniref:CARDB domain-containing protein n=1 Tax=Vreelandella nanhaiensis TaxID=1258546 RepID=A0A433KY82_9GAMM|nr:hypothetical protein [Halomonas nanhaiensis]RUR34470.1 hypothetical protein ELY38_02450 [Halomonas nanhaiensis]
MNRLLIACSACLLSMSAQADVAVIDASLLPDALGFEVIIENSGDRAVARGYIAARFITPGRAVPWVDSWEQSYHVPGGVEPGDTYALEIDAPGEIQSIKNYEVVPEVIFFSAFDVDGVPLNEDAEVAIEALEADRRETEALLRQLEELKSD